MIPPSPAYHINLFDTYFANTPDTYPKILPDVALKDAPVISVNNVIFYGRDFHCFFASNVYLF